MKLLKQQTKIDFMSQRRLAVALSGALILMSLLSFAFRGLSLGIDFTGGTLIEVGYPESVELNQVRATLAEAGFDEAVVQHYGTSRDVMVRLAPREDLSKAELSTEILRALRRNGGEGLELRRVEFVGPQVGDELTEQGGLAMLFALGAIFVYVMLRYEWRFSTGAVAAVIHDAVVTIGFFSVLGLEFDLTVLAAVLAVIGYSLNDTIVVYDRIRENFRRMRRGTPVEIVNASVNQTLSRTLMTSFTTLLVVFALFFVGGELIHNFSIALVVGIVTGTYSTIWVASAAALYLGVSRADLMPVAKEGAEEAEARP